MPTHSISPMVRVAVIVSDLDRSIAFYRDLLGLDQVYFEGTLTDPAIEPLLGLTDFAYTKAAILKAAEPAVGMVGLFQIDKPPKKLRREEPGASVGDTCLVFYVDDLQALTAALEAGGHTIIQPPSPLKIREGFQSSEMTFKDPDGVMINCIQREPDAVWAERKV